MKNKLFGGYLKKPSACFQVAFLHYFWLDADEWGYLKAVRPSFGLAKARSVCFQVAF